MLRSVIFSVQNYIFVIWWSGFNSLTAARKWRVHSKIHSVETDQSGLEMEEQSSEVIVPETLKSRAISAFNIHIAFHFN